MKDEKKNMPKVRFSGFSDAWELRKLKELAEFNPKSNLPSKFEYVDLESVVGTKMVGHRTEKKDSAPSRAKRLAQKNDVFYQTVRPYQKNNYLFDLPYDNFVFSTGYAQMRPKNNGHFLLTLVQEEKFVNRVLERSTGTSYPAINSNDLAKLSVKVPTDNKEQQQIGTFFKLLDDTIALHQRKLEALKEMKKGFLQQFFPQKGEKVPRVRFANFHDEWELRKLEQIFKTIRNAFVGTATPFYVDFNDNGYFYLESNNVKGGQINRKTEVFINKEFYNKQKDKWLKTGDLVMVQSGHVGHTAVISPELNNTAAHALIMFQNKKFEVNSDFLNYQFQTEKIKKNLDVITTGNTIKHILASEMKKFHLEFPQTEEQNKIVGFFQKMDSTIVLHQNKLEQLKILKKTYLQNMFI